MTILATQTWNTPPDFLIERSTFWGFLYVWWTGCLVQSGRDTIVREVPFGGYQVRITVDSSFWYADSSGWRHDQILENLYAMAPGSSTPINMGAVSRQIEYYGALDAYVCVITSEPNGAYGRWQAFPWAPENAGLPNRPPSLPETFFTDPINPGVIKPAVYC